MTKEWIIDQLIKKLGFEHPATVWFAQFCEEHPDADIKKLYILADELVGLVELANAVEEE